MLQKIHDTYFLVAIIDNDYVDSHLFDLFTELMAKQKHVESKTSRSRNSAAADDATWF